MDILVILLSLGLLIYAAYKGFSVILFAPICALLAVFLTEPGHVLPFFSNIFMVKMVDFIKNYFPVFLLGAIFGKVIEISGVANKIAKLVIRMVGAQRAILAIVLMCAILTYSGVSVFVVVFAVYPFAKQLFQKTNIPKRLIPGTIALGGFSFTMDALPGTPQIQNVIPTTFFQTDIYAAPTLGIIGAVFMIVVGMFYLERCRRKAATIGEGYSGKIQAGEAEMAASLAVEINEVEPNKEKSFDAVRAKDWLAFLPLVLIGVMNKYFSVSIPKWYADGFDFSKIGLEAFGSVNMSSVVGIWSVELALIIGIVSTIALNFKEVKANFQENLNVGIGGSLLATMNTASEYGFGSVIAALPGFAAVQHGISGAFTNPLVNSAVTTSTLAGVTGSASGGMSIALGVMAEKYMAAAAQFNIPPEVLHRVVSMASGGMDTLPHNGGVITLLAVTGLTHKEAYKDIFAITIIKTLAVAFIILVYTLTGIV
ncbi:GntP family permease [Mesobacillus maritimus]|uniref:GntP family permease n=1 Tax=Mesobacillus maritimus TaxID=1643336 RepID=UPI00384B9686